MAICKSLGFVLRKEYLRETSIILTVYTRDYGKIKGVVKGARTRQQLFTAGYELCALDEIVFYEKKKKNIYTFSQCDLVEYFPKARRELGRLAQAVYMAELLDASTSFFDKDRAIFDILFNSMRFLSSSASPKRVARIFEIKLLAGLGIMPRLDSCASCGREISGGTARFGFFSGGLLCERCSGKDRSSMPLSRGSINFISRIHDLPFEKVGRIKVSFHVGGEVERLLRKFIKFHLDVSLKSLDFIDKIGV